jgi:integrase
VAAENAGLNPEGVQKLSFHDLRHTAITHLIRSGADPAQVSRFAGHSKVSTTLDLYVGEWEKRRANDSGTRLAAIYAEANETASRSRGDADDGVDHPVTGRQTSPS